MPLSTKQLKLEEGLLSSCTLIREVGCNKDSKFAFGRQVYALMFSVSYKNEIKMKSQVGTM